mmetsp:Transcript_8352/g.12071  ORF Transcript_8352/g.12071 Transcript_8352/m.12071 type:complete len:208 (-) Transcript_8352:100-723(-)
MIQNEDINICVEDVVESHIKVVTNDCNFAPVGLTLLIHEKIVFIEEWITPTLRVTDNRLQGHLAQGLVGVKVVICLDLCLSKHSNNRNSSGIFSYHAPQPSRRISVIAHAAFVFKELRCLLVRINKHSLSGICRIKCWSGSGIILGIFIPHSRTNITVLQNDKIPKFWSYSLKDNTEIGSSCRSNVITFNPNEILDSQLSVRRAFTW